MTAFDIMDKKLTWTSLLYNFAIKSDEIPNNYANVSKIYTDKANKNTSAFYIIDKKNSSQMKDHLGLQRVSVPNC
jgi:hypothetical protein